MKATAAKPILGGAVAYGALGITLPTNAVDTPSNVEKCGYISEEGIVRTMEMDNEVVKAWGGDVVLILDRGKTEKFKFVLIEPANLAVLKLLHGEDYVSGTLSTGIAVQSNSKEKGGHAFVIDMLEADDTAHRICIPDGVITNVDEITYTDSGAVGYGIEITAIADENGNTCYEYFKSSDSASTPTILLNTHAATVAAGSTVTLSAVTYPAGATVTWDSGNDAVATVAAGVVTGVAAGNTIISASITQDGVTYDDTCTVIVTA